MNAEIKERFEATIEKYSISQNVAAKDIGYSATALSQWRAGTYSGDEGKVEDAIVKWIGRVERSHAKEKIPVLETKTLRKIVNAIEMAHTEKDIALIVDDAGAGKSTAARWYTEQNPRTTVLIPVVEGMTRKILVTEVAKQAGVDTYRVPYQTLIQNTAKALAERDMVVIIDEADSLKKDALEFSRRLVYDLGNSGLVLIGLPRLTYAIQNLKNDHRQLESRIGIYLPLAGLTKDDAMLIARSVWPGVSREVVKAISDVSKTDVRQFVKIIERARTVMAVNKKAEPDEAVIELAASMVIRRNWR